MKLRSPFSLKAMLWQICPMANTQNFCHQLLTPKCEQCQRVRERDKEGEMENFIIIKGLKMRRDAFFDPRGYKYINITPFHFPPPHCPPQLLAPLDAAAIAAASSSCLSQKKSQCQIGVVLEILLSTYNLLFYNRKLIKANQTISPTQNRTRCLVLYCQV